MGEARAAIGQPTLVYATYAEPNPQDAHHSMKGVGWLVKNGDLVKLVNVPGCEPKVQDIGVFEELELTEPDDAPAEFITDDGSTFTIYRAVPSK